VKRTLGLGIAVLALAGVTACGSSHASPGSPPARFTIPADKPPSPATWPVYPRFSQHSCWGRPFQKGDRPIVARAAPSYAPAPRAHPIPPAEIVRRFLARFGDRRYVHAIRLLAPPPAVGSNVHALYADGHPPSDALAARIVAPLANDRAEPAYASTAQKLTFAIARWEAGLVGGALRDDFCSAGGRPLIWWEGDATGVANDVFAVEQRFPTPSPAAFRRRVALVGRRFGFRVVTLRLLRPEQIAPLLVVETSRSRKSFAHEVPRIMSLLDPVSSSGQRTAQTFEGFLFAAEDAKGPFLDVESSSRGEGEGGEWAANQCLYPYPVIGMIDLPGKKQPKCS